MHYFSYFSGKLKIRVYYKLHEKVQIFIFLQALSAVVLSRIHNNGNTSVKYNETEHTYGMKADFHEAETRKVKEYLNHTIGAINNMSFINTQIDPTLPLDD